MADEKQPTIGVDVEKLTAVLSVSGALLRAGEVRVQFRSQTGQWHEIRMPEATARDLIARLQLALQPADE